MEVSCCLGMPFFKGSLSEETQKIQSSDWIWIFRVTTGSLFFWKSVCQAYHAKIDVCFFRKCHHRHHLVILPSPGTLIKTQGTAPDSHERCGLVIQQQHHTFTTLHGTVEAAPGNIKFGRLDFHIFHVSFNWSIPEKLQKKSGGPFEPQNNVCPPKRNGSETTSISIQRSCVDFHIHPPPSGADCLHKHKPWIERMALSVLSLHTMAVTPLTHQTEMKKPRCPKSGVQFQLPHVRMSREISHLSEKLKGEGCWGLYNAHSLVDHVGNTGQ